VRTARERVGALIRSHRKELQYTQEFLGELVGVSQATISDWETGKASPSWDHQWALAQNLHFSSTEFMGARFTDDPVEHAIMSARGLNHDAKEALVGMYRVLLHHKPT
jgi:transcriptional regulator with XRE-family HTH domain